MIVNTLTAAKHITVSGLSIGKTTNSITLRFKTPSSFANDQSLFFYGNVINTGNPILYVETDSGILRIYTSTSGYRVTETLDVDRIYDLVITRDGTAQKIYLNGILIDDATLTFSSETDGNLYFTSSDFTSGVNNFDFISFKQYNRVLSSSDAKDYHNSFIKPVLRETFSDSPVGATHTRGWSEISGDGAIEEETTGNAIVPLGTKKWTQDTAGIRAIQSKSAYGEWEFNVNKGTASLSRYYPIMDTVLVNNGYRLLLNADESLRFAKMTSGAYGGDIFVTAASCIDNNTDYRIKVARLKSAGTFASIVPTMTTVYDANTFAVFIKGGDFGNEYTSVETASGTNPRVDATYKTSEFFVTDLDEDDSISNILITNDNKQ